MATATRSRQDSTVEVVDILNHSGGRSTDRSGKRKRTDNPVQRAPGRPRKRSKAAQDTKTAVSGITTIPEATGAELHEQPTHSVLPQSSTRLRNPKSASSARPRESTDKMATRIDIYAPPTSPELASTAIIRSADEDASEYSLENSAFDPVPSSKEPGADSANSPSHNTRSKVVRAGPMSQQASPKLSQRLVRVRNLGPKVVVKDTLGDDSLEAAGEKRKPTPNSRILSRQVLRTGHRALEAATVASDKFGYPSPEKWSGTNNSLKNRAGRLDASLASKKGGPSRKGGEAGKNITDLQNDDAEAEADEEVEDEEWQTAAEEEEEEDEEIEADQDKEAETGAKFSEREGEELLENPDGQTRATHGHEGNAAIAVTDTQLSKPSKRRGKLEKAADLHKCEEHWTIACDAAKKNQHKSDPETKPVRELVEAIRNYEKKIREAPIMTEREEEDSLSRLDESNLDKIATAIGNLKQSGSRTGEDEKRLIGDIYVHAIPQVVGLLRSIQVVRSLNGELSMSALDELVMILKAMRRLCDRVYHWKPGPKLKDRIKSRTNLEIKPSLKCIEDAYDAALTKLRTSERQGKAKLQEEEFARRRAREDEECRQRKLERRREFDNWIEKDMAMRQTERTMQSRQPAPESNRHLDLEPDDIDISTSSPQPADRFEREATEDIPAPTKRDWQKEEILALIWLLQKYRGSNRYEKIQESISQLAREIRKLGPDKALKMRADECASILLDRADDVLDDLGNMDLADIEEEARYLKASSAREIALDMRKKPADREWGFLSCV